MDTSIDRRLRDGRLHKLYRGVYACGHTALSERGSWMAAVLACGPGAVLSGPCAASLHGAWKRRVPATPSVLVPRRSPRPSGIDVVETRRLLPHERKVIDGIPVATLARVVVDLADHFPADLIANVIHTARVRPRMLPLHDLRRAIDEHKHRRGPGPARVRAGFRLYETGSCGRRSDSEGRIYAAVVERFGDLFTYNVRWDPGDGREPWEPDLRSARWKLIIEHDGDDVHALPAEQRRDREHDARAELAGYRTLRFLASRVDVDLTGVLNEIETALRARGWKPSGRGRRRAVPGVPVIA